MGWGGKVTPEWIEALKEKGFDAYAELDEEFVRSLDANNEAEMIFNGMSMGATVAEKTARNLASWKPIRVIMDNPVTNHGVAQRVIKALQIPVGFAGESAALMAFNKNMKLEVAAEEAFNKEFERVLGEKGIQATDSKDQTRLKGAAVRTDVLMMIKGSPLDTDEVQTYIRRGMYDPTTLSPVNLARVFARAPRSHGIIQDTKAKGVKEYAIGSTHFIDRIRVKKWDRVINMARDIDKPFKESGGGLQAGNESTEP